MACDSLVDVDVVDLRHPFAQRRGHLEIGLEPLDEAFVAEPQLRRAVAEGVPVSFEMHSPHVQRWIEIRAFPSEQGLSVFFRDRSEHKQAEQALQDSEEHFRLATRAVNGSSSIKRATARQFRRSMAAVSRPRNASSSATVAPYGLGGR